MVRAYHTLQYKQKAYIHCTRWKFDKQTHFATKKKYTKKKNKNFIAKSINHWLVECFSTFAKIFSLTVIWGKVENVQKKWYEFFKAYSHSTLTFQFDYLPIKVYFNFYLWSFLSSFCRVYWEFSAEEGKKRWVILVSHLRQFVYVGNCASYNGAIFITTKYFDNNYFICIFVFSTFSLGTDILDVRQVFRSIFRKIASLSEEK